MGINVKATKQKIWRKDIEGRNGTFYKYSTSVGQKNIDGDYVNAYIPVMFTKKSDAPEKIENGALCDFEGFLSVESYTDSAGRTRNNPRIVISSVKFEDPTTGVDSFNAAEEDIPF